MGLLFSRQAYPYCCHNIREQITDILHNEWNES